MNKEKIYELLDIDSPKDFIYFDNFANLVECDEPMDFAVLVELVKNVDRDCFIQVMEEYFDYVMDNIPEEENQLYTIFDNIKRSLIGMAQNIKDDTEITNLTSEIERFRKWYNEEASVSVTDISSLEEKKLSIRDALVYPIIEKLEGGTYQYDFSNGENYEMEEYIMSFQDMMALNEEE